MKVQDTSFTQHLSLSTTFKATKKTQLNLATVYLFILSFYANLSVDCCQVGEKLTQSKGPK